MHNNRAPQRAVFVGTAAIGLLLLTGCIRYSVPVVITNPDQASLVKFPGVATALKSQPVVNLVVVHGMGSQDSTYADGFLAELQREANLVVDAQCSLADTLITEYGSYATVHRCSYRAANGNSLRVFVLTWANLTQAFENALLAYDWQRHGQTRARINRQLKRDLIDTAFSDAVLYSGTFAPVLRSAIERTVCVVLMNKSRADQQCVPGEIVDSKGSPQTKQPPIFLVTHSLGSALVMDTLGLMLTPAKPAAAQPGEVSEPGSAAASRVFIQNLRAVYMIANQLPLIYLSRIPPTPARASQPSETDRWRQPRLPTDLSLQQYLDSLLSITKALLPLREPIAIVSFNDPNDLLTFPISAGWRDRIAPGAGDRLQVVNIDVTNAPARWLGVAVNPSPAHVGYWTNRTVVDFIAHGN